MAKIVRKISLMYQWSGGCDYRHTCGECMNFQEHRVGNKKVFKCASYGVSSSEATDWRKSWMACRAFDLEPPAVPLFETGITRRRTKMPKDITVIGQMCLEDFI